MAKWHRARGGDLGLRALGLGACALAYASIAYLVRLRASEAAHASASTVEFLLATIGFLSASGGSAMLLLGAHLFDRIEVSERWRVKPAARRSSSSNRSTT